MPTGLVRAACGEMTVVPTTTGAEVIVVVLERPKRGPMNCMGSSYHANQDVKKPLRRSSDGPKVDPDGPYLLR